MKRRLTLSAAGVDDDLVPAVLLGAVERTVSAAKDVVGFLCLGQAGDTGREGDRSDRSSVGTRTQRPRGKRGTNSIDVRRCLDRSDTFEQHDEFLAALAPDEHALA